MKITKENKTPYIIASFAIFNLIYLFSAYFSFAELRLLPLNEFESSISQNNLFIWAYIFIQSFSFYTVSLDKDYLFIKRWIISSLIFSIICLVIFQLFPVAYHFQNTIALNRDFLTERLLYSLRLYGTDNASFPALYIGLAFNSAFLKLAAKPTRRVGSLYLLVVLFMGYSALALKQLYFSAIVASCLLSIVITLTSRKALKN
jgi:hypothetical protein